MKSNRAFHSIQTGNHFSFFIIARIASGNRLPVAGTLFVTLADADKVEWVKPLVPFVNGAIGCDPVEIAWDRGLFRAFADAVQGTRQAASGKR